MLGNFLTKKIVIAAALTTQEREMNTDPDH